MSGRIISNCTSKMQEGSSSSGIGSMQGPCRCRRHHRHPYNISPQTPSPAPLVIEDIEIPVWVGSSEKWLTGLTKRTTCDDVIYSLLCQESSSSGSSSTSASFQNVANYAIYEQWRGVKRPLKGRTKITKVWRAWGSDSRNVKLFLCKMDSNLDTSSEVSRQWHRRRGSRDKGARGEKGKEKQRRSNGNHRRDVQNSQSGAKHKGSRDPSLPHPEAQVYSKRERTYRDSADQSRADKSRQNGIHHHQQDEVWIDAEPQRSSQTVSKAFSKSMTAEDDIPAAAMRLRECAEYQELFCTIKEQESVIQQQLQQLTEADLQISSCDQRSRETKRLATDIDTNTDGSLFPNIKANDTEAYLHMCDNILHLQEKIDHEFSRIDELSASVREEQKLDANSNLSVCSSQGYSQQVQDEVEEIKQDLKRSISLSMAQQKQLQLVSETLNSCEAQLRIKRQYVERLSKENERLGNMQIAPNDGIETHLDLCPSSGIESGIETSPESQPARSQNRFVRSTSTCEINNSTGTNSRAEGNIEHRERAIGARDSNSYPLQGNPMRTAVDRLKLSNDNDNVQDLSSTNQATKSSNLKSILKSKSQGYSVRFADEVNGNSDYVNVDPCLTQVFEYSKYDTHNYVNLDDLDQGCYDDDDIHYDEGEEDEVEEDIDWILEQTKAYNVDTGELCYAPQNDAQSNSQSMVPYRTYQVRTPDHTEVPSIKTSSSDDNSDTGLSSMHSDDPIPPVLETLV